MPESSREDGLRSIPELLDRVRGTPAATELSQALRDIRAASTQELLRRLPTAADSLRMWAVHLELDRRNVPPCIRWPKRVDDPQLLFIAWLADVHWTTRRHPEHKPFFTRWKGLFARPIDPTKWHRVAIWAYRSGHGIPSHYHAKGLGLSESQREALMTMESSRMRRERRLLKKIDQHRQQIRARAASKPDRSGKMSADDIAARRALVLRLFILAGRCRTTGAKYYEMRTGQTLSRQAFTRQLETVEIATGLRLLNSS